MVPGSSKRVGTVEGHGCTIFSLSFLKGHYEAGMMDGDEFCEGSFISYVEQVGRACREMKVSVREITPEMKGEVVEEEGKGEDEEGGKKEEEVSGCHWMLLLAHLLSSLDGRGGAGGRAIGPVDPARGNHDQVVRGPLLPFCRLLHAPQSHPDLR